MSLPDPKTLAPQLANAAPAIRLTALFAIPSDSPDPAHRRAWAALLPTDLAAWPPEAQRFLAQRYHQLHPWRATPDLPKFQTVRLLPAVALAWWRTLFLTQPRTLQTLGPAQEIHYQALAGLTVADVPYPEQFLTALAARPEEYFQTLATDLLRDCLVFAVLSPAMARRILLALCCSMHLAVVERAVTQLRAPWALCGDCPRDLLLNLLAVAPEPVIQTLAAWRQTDLLTAIFRDSARPPSHRRAAMVALGGLGERELLPDILTLAAADPLYFGPAGVACLAEFHHRGLFLRPEQVPDLMTVCAGSHQVDLATVAMIAYTVRNELVQDLATRSPEDPGWIRWVRLLGLVPSAQAAPVLLRMLSDAVERQVQLSVMETLARIGCLEAEEPLLHLLKMEPAACLAALRVVGGQRTADRLRRLLDSGIAPTLRPWRNQALALLWHLTPDRQELLSRLNPADLPAEIRRDLGPSVPPEVVRLLMQAEPKAHRCLEALCQLGGSEVLPLVTDLLMRHVSELNAVEICNEAERGEARSFVFESVKMAIRRLGERLHGCGKIRPVCLLTESATQAGQALLVDLVLTLIETRQPAPGERKILLEALDGLTCPPPRFQQLLRDKDPAIRKVVIRLLGQQQAQGLAFNLGRLTSAEEVETVRPTLEALGKLRATWAVERIVACLAHPNMNIRKTAAEALRTAGTVQAVPHILRCLGEEDNPGFRESLLEALRAILGNTVPVTLLAALEQASVPRQRELLVLALNRLLSVLAVRRAVQSKANYAELLLRALQERRIHLASGSLTDLTAELVLHGLSMPPVAGSAPGTDIASPDIAAIMAHGWGTARIPALLALEPSEHTRWVVRQYLREWLTLLDGSQAGSAAWRLFLDAVADLGSGDLGLIGERLPHLMATFDPGSADVAGMLRLLGRLIPSLTRPQSLQVATYLRSLPRLGIQEGATRFRLLQECGVLRTRDDLLRVATDCLDAAPGILLAALNAGHSEELSGLTKSLRQTPVTGWDAILDRMLTLQPLDVPPWTLTETTLRDQEAREKHHLRQRDLVFQREPSATVRAELTALLTDPDGAIRQRAAQTLLSWPETEREHEQILHRFVQGELDVDASGRHVLAPLVRDREPLSDSPPATLSRWLDLCEHGTELARCQTWLLRLWQEGPPDLAKRAAGLLRRIPADVLLPRVCVEVGQHRLAFVDLLYGPVLRSAESERVLAILEAAGDLARAERFRRLLVPGCLQPPPDCVESLRVPLPAPVPPTRAGLFTIARGTDEAAIRVALKSLVHDADAEAIALFREFTQHRRPRVRSLALRCLRKCAQRDVYLEAAAGFLRDPRPEAQRSAIRIVSHGGYQPAIPVVLELVHHKNQAVRRAAAEGLLLYGTAALPHLHHAMGRARPDRKRAYEGIIQSIAKRE